MAETSLRRMKTDKQFLGFAADWVLAASLAGGVPAASRFSVGRFRSANTYCQ